ASSVLDRVPMRGLPLALILLTRVAATGFGIAAGLALLARRPAAVTLAKISLIATAALDVFVYSTPFFPNNRPPGDTPIYVAASPPMCTRSSAPISTIEWLAEIDATIGYIAPPIRTLPPFAALRGTPSACPTGSVAIHTGRSGRYARS